MYQSWLELTFVHWALDPSVIQPLLPPGLEPDTLDGMAYLSFVPFTMKGVRARWQPDIPAFSNFHEWNLRTYVRDKDGSPGVWFFSLEASNPIAVLIARGWYKLPYHFGRMSLVRKEATTEYHCARKWPGPQAAPCKVLTAVKSSPAPAKSNTLDFWLLERYQLYSWGHNRLYRGRVTHSPYTVCQAELLEFDVTIMAAEGFENLGAPLPIVQYSPGVSVEVFPLTRCD